uniref:Uncharacterized protein n=1 Tax=Lotharella globosa TaxID=91324 RepID=A0A7S4DY68_9EUKA
MFITLMKSIVILVRSDSVREEEPRPKKTSCHRPLTPFGTKAKGGLVSEFGITERGSNEFDLKSSFGIVKTKEYVPPYPENEIHGLFLHMETANKRFDKLKKSREGAQASLFDGLVL